MGILIIVLLILGVMFLPPLIFATVGFRKRKTNPESAKVYYILAVVYLIISGGICYSILN